MKPTVFFMLVLFSSSVTLGQKYVPFPTENAEWNAMYSSYSEGTGHRTISISNYSLKGDTIINGVTYKNVCLNIGSNETPVYVGIGGLREDNKRVYYIGGVYPSSSYAANRQQIKRIKDCDYSENVQTEGEMLLYDFNLKVGDNVRLGYYDSYIFSIDSILIGNSYRKRYNTGYDVIVEGIGSIQKGLLGSLIQVPTCGAGMSWEFVCFSQNGECVYKNPAYKECNSTQKWSDVNSLKTNTQWYYGQIDYPFYTSTIKYENYNSLKSIGDTTINNIKCNILSQVRGNAGCASYENITFVYQSNDTVFFYNSNTNKFSTMYVYGADKGDSWTVAYPYADVSVVVDSVGSLNALGNTLKVQYVTFSGLGYSYYSVSENSTIIENIGDINYFFKSSEFHPGLVCDEFGIDRTGLRCYVHPDLGTFSRGTVACDYVTTALSNTEYKLVKVYLTSPDNLKIESEMLTDPCTFELMDMRGSVLLRTKVNAKKSSIDFSNYNKGLYLYRLINKGKLLKTGKIVKM